MTLLVPPPSAAPAEPPAAGWRPRSDADLLTAQLRALDEWHRRVGSPVAVIPGQSREARLDEARRRDVVKLEREALHAWAEGALLAGFQLGAGAVPRAVVAHRNEWLRAKVSAGLTEHGVEVIASTDDGAQASAAIVMEQPDLVFIEDLLPTVTGVELMTRARDFAPEALVGAHALGQSGMPALLAAGARAAFSRRIPPAEIAAQLVACLHGQVGALTLV